MLNFVSRSIWERTQHIFGCVLVDAPDGSSVKARAILDSVLSASIVSEHLSQSLRLPQFQLVVQTSGIAGLSHNSLFKLLLS